MSLDEFNAYCETLPHSSFVEQWGKAQVWKIGGKVFAIGGWNQTDGEDAQFCVTFKVSDMAYEILRDSPGCRPAPYLASRGMKWIQRTGRETLSDEALKQHIEASYRLVAKGLSKKLQKQLGLLETG